MLTEVAIVCSVEEPFVSIIYDEDSDSLVTCTYSKNTCQRSGKIRILNRLTLEDVFSVQLSSAAFHLEFQPHAKLYLSGLGDGQIALFDAKSRELKIDKPKPFAGQMVTDAKLSKDSRVVAFTDKSSALRVYEREGLKVKFEKRNAHSLYGQPVDAWSCEFLDGTYAANLIASGGDDNCLKVWDVRDKNKGPAQINKSHTGGVVRVRHAHGYLCTGSYDEHLRFFDLRRMDNPVRSVKFDGGVWDFQFDDSQKRILIANMYNGVAILDSESLEVKCSHKMPDQLIYGITSIAKLLSIYCCSFTSGLAWRFTYS